MKIIIVALCLVAGTSADVFGWSEGDQDLDHVNRLEWEPEVEAAPPKPCCTPAQWEGNLGEFTAYYNFRHHHPGLALMGARLSYDSKAKKVAVTAKVNKRPPVKIILDYTAGKSYVIFNSTKRCRVAKTRKPFAPACIPKTAKFLGPFYQGAGAAKLNENAWVIKARGFGVVAAVTKAGCIPVGEQVMGHARGTLVASSIGYSGITAGIKDPNVFKPPSFCKAVDEEDLNAGEEYPILEYFRLKFQEEE